MIPRIKSVKPLENFRLKVIFDDGENCIYNVLEDINAIPEFKELKTVCGLFEQVQIDKSRTCIFWNDVIDIASDTIYEYGEHCAIFADAAKEKIEREVEL